MTKRHGDKSSAADRKRKRPNKDSDETDDEEGYENFAGIMQEVDAANLEDALSSIGVSKPKPKTSKKGKSLCINSPPPAIPEAPGNDGEEALSTATAPDKPLKRPRPRPRSALNVEVDQLSHPHFIPGDESTAHLWTNVSKLSVIYLRRTLIPFVRRRIILKLGRAI